MKMLHILLIAGTTVLTGTAAAGAWVAHHGSSKFACMHGQGDKKAMVMNHLTKELKLTADQQKEISAVMDSIHTMFASKHASKEAVIKGMLNDFASNNVTEEKIIQHWNEHITEMDDVVPVIASQLVKLNTILTSEQRAKIVEKIESFHNGNGPHNIF